MTEEICSQGHVLDWGARTCSRCGGQAIGIAQSTPVVEAPAGEEEKVEAPVEEVVVEKKKRGRKFFK